MNDDIVKRLRTEGDDGGAPIVNDSELLNAAADEIERLRAALERISDLTPSDGGAIHGPTRDDYRRMSGQAQEIASAALEAGRQPMRRHRVARWRSGARDQRRAVRL